MKTRFTDQYQLDTPIALVPEMADALAAQSPLQLTNGNKL
jgi:hypothetical protein